MTREIKFRGKKFCQDEWIYGSLITRGERGADGNFIDTGRGECYPLQQDTVGQFTGIYDKNGKEIYEGDIVLWERKRVHIEGRPVQDFSNVCKIYYDEQKHAFCFWFKMSCGSASGLLNFNDDRAESSSIEVIGNIYDNPELLTKEA